MRSTALLLGFCQLLFMAAAAVGISFNGLVGAGLAGSPALATLPFLFITASTALLTLVLPRLFARLGYGGGFALGAFAGGLGGVFCAWAVWAESFWWFCIACLFMGGYQATALYYRFAAADSVVGAQKSTAIAWVLSGGVIAALVGPWLGRQGLHFYATEYLGSYLLTAVLAVLALPVLYFARLPARQLTPTPKAPLSLSAMFKHPVFLPAVLFCAGGYGLMMFVMLAGPLAMAHCGFGAGEAASVIQWHLLGMFAPSLLTGKIIVRFGAQPVALCGCGILGVGCITALTGMELWQFHLSLLLVGVGWNFMYMGGSTLLSQVSEEHLRGRLQSFNEFITYSVMALTAGGTGIFYHQLGWSSVLGASLGFLIIVIGVGLFSLRKAGAAIVVAK